MGKRTASRKSRLDEPVPSNTDPPAPLIGALLRFALEAAHVRLLAGLAEAGFDDITEAHLKVVRFPPPDGVRPHVLAKRAKVTKQAMNYLLVQLEELGYIERRTAPESPIRLVYLTRRGWKVAEVARASMSGLQREWAARVGKARFTTFMDVLRELTSLPEGSTKADPG